MKSVLGVILALLGALASALSCGASAETSAAGMALIPAGSFVMGDHHGFVDPRHGSDETPLHTVRLDAFYMAACTVTTEAFCDFLSASLSQGQIQVRKGLVYRSDTDVLVCETREFSPYSRIGWDGKRFAVLDNKGKHPIVCIRWHGAAMYCNWLSARQGLQPCYDTQTWECNFNRSAYRLPTEAEWEYAARGGLQNPYRNFPWGDEPDSTKVNCPSSTNPFRSGPLPWTCPVAFFDGSLRRKADFGWPGDQGTFQTSNNANGYGLFDMSGNVWQFVNDLYSRNYYSFSPAENPAGPASGTPMPDGKPYRGMRGGNWYNGEFGHGRVSNRNPSYFRGPMDPDHPYYHIGFRIVLPVNAETRPLIKPTPVQRSERHDAKPGEPRKPGADRRRTGSRGPDQSPAMNLSR